MTRRASWIFRAVSCLLIAGEIVLFAALQRRYSATEARPAFEPETHVSGAVPELSRQRHLMLQAEQAIRDGDGGKALAVLQAAKFEGRPVEAYRRYYLANAQELLGMRREARATLAELWATDPVFVRRVDVAFHLADLYEVDGDWSSAAEVLGGLARDDSPAVADAAYQRVRTNLVASGDMPRLVELARHLAVRAATTPAGARAARDLESLDVDLTRIEQIDRVAALAAKGDATKALADIQRLRRSGTTLRLEQARAEALARQGKREEADGIVFAFVGRSATLDRSLIASSWRWWSAAAASTENRAWKNVRVRRRSGTTRVKVGRRWVDRPVYTTVTRRVKGSLGTDDRRRLAAVNRILIERGERLIALGVDRELAREIHARLAHAELSPRRQKKLEEHVRQLVEIDSTADEMLQLTWDEGWSAWRKRDLDTARERFAFIRSAYPAPNIRRQAFYWYARCLEESGETAEASRHYRELAGAPYDDVYSLLARERAAPDEGALETAFVPFSDRPDEWVSRADLEMPEELRLAWELSLLGLNHDARTEIRANVTDANRSWAYSILARIHRSEGSPLLVSHTLRIAWPEIGTVEQDRVPVHFLRMYYPKRYHDVIETEASRHGLEAALVKGLVLQESAYDPTARSGAGATGLMQLMAPTAREMAPRVGLDWNDKALADPTYNITIGTYYLRTLFREFGGDPVLTLAAYNGGTGNVRRWLRKELKGRAPDEVVESIPFSETRGYVKRVIIYQSAYQKLDGSP